MHQANEAYGNLRLIAIQPIVILNFNDSRDSHITNSPFSSLLQTCIYLHTAVLLHIHNSYLFPARMSSILV